jgi:hypothetical protein
LLLAPLMHFPPAEPEEVAVLDLVFVLVTVGFFMLAVGYLDGCARL